MNERLKQIRKEHNLSIEKMAQILGIPGITYSNYEKGKTIPRLDFLKTLVEKFGINSHWFLFGGMPPKIEQLKKENSNLPKDQELENQRILAEQLKNKFKDEENKITQIEYLK